jgi:hypothetical protein
MTLERIAIYLLLLVLAFFSGFIKGCSHEKQQYKEAETKFIERTKIVKEIERVEVPKFIEKVKWLNHTETVLIEAAKNETPNPAVCDFSPDRVRRINQAATATP